MYKTILHLLEGILLSLAATFMPIEHLLVTTFAMIMIDLATGIVAAKKRGEKITSSGLKKTLVKILVYESSIMVAFLAEHYMSNAVPFIKMSSAMIALVELKSIYENLNLLSGSSMLQSLLDTLNTKTPKP